MTRLVFLLVLAAAWCARAGAEPLPYTGVNLAGGEFFEVG